MQIDPDLLERFGIDQETFDRLRSEESLDRVYTRDEYRALNDRQIWEDQCRASLARSVEQRITNGFYRQHRPVLDDEPVRAFKTMAEYRDWCETALPPHLGFRRVKAPEQRSHVARKL